MNYFEQYPVLLVPAVIIITEAWQLAKRLLTGRRDRRTP